MRGPGPGQAKAPTLGVVLSKSRDRVRRTSLTHQANAEHISTFPSKRALHSSPPAKGRGLSDHIEPT
jgi:hypothetical protein